MSKTYVVTTINLDQKTDEMLRLDFEITKLRYPQWQTKTFEDYYEFQQSWDWHRYHFSTEDNAYFAENEFEEARNFILRNTCGLDDGGAFNYAVIRPMDHGRAYAFTDCESLHLFRFDRELDTFVDVGLNENVETRHIVKALGHKNLLKE